MTTFSILGRIGGDATNGTECGPHRPRRLSVSSVGSEAMQHLDGMTERYTVQDFQYPRSDRRRCNVRWPGARYRFAPLSVSSVGSEAMQLGDEAVPLLDAMNLFQYPRSDRRRCNPASPGPMPKKSPFQYPRSDRRRCNKPYRQRRAPGQTAFSILGRIGGDATSFRPSWSSRPQSFSILGRIGGDATRLFGADRGEFHSLSVSSVGSEAMQLSQNAR